MLCGGPAAEAPKAVWAASPSAASPAGGRVAASLSTYAFSLYTNTCYLRLALAPWGPLPAFPFSGYIPGKKNFGTAFAYFAFSPPPQPHQCSRPALAVASSISTAVPRILTYAICPQPHCATGAPTHCSLAVARGRHTLICDRRRGHDVRRGRNVCRARMARVAHGSITAL